MNKHILLFLFTIHFALFYCQSWTQLTDFPGGPRDDGTVFTINNKAFCYTGLEPGWNCQRNGFIFDGTTEIWSPMAWLPSGKERQYATSFSYNGNGYLFGGLYCSNVCVKDFWMYTVTTNSWTALPDFPGTERQGMSNFIIKNKVFVIGGRDQSNTTLSEVWEYDFISSMWTQKNNLPFSGMWRGAAFSIDTVGYVCYGMNTNSFNHQFYQYDVLNDTWVVIPNIFLPARNYISCAVTNKKACLYGGQDSLNLVTNNMFVFNPIDTSLVSYSGIPTIGRKGGMAFSLNDVFYVTTGLDENGQRVKETWKNTSFVGIKEYDNSNDLKVYPNPCRETITIDLSNQNNAVIKLTNQYGQIVFEEKTESRILEINTSYYPSGIYYLSLQTNQTYLTKKIIISY